MDTQKLWTEIKRQFPGKARLALIQVVIQTKINTLEWVLADKRYRINRNFAKSREKF